MDNKVFAVINGKEYTRFQFYRKVGAILIEDRINMLHEMGCTREKISEISGYSLKRVNEIIDKIENGVNA